MKKYIIACLVNAKPPIALRCMPTPMNMALLKR
jgi:hypothetical protein